MPPPTVLLLSLEQLLRLVLRSVMATESSTTIIEERAEGKYPSRTCLIAVTRRSKARFCRASDKVDLDLMHIKVPHRCKMFCVEGARRKNAHMITTGSAVILRL